MKIVIFLIISYNGKKIIDELNNLFIGACTCIAKRKYNRLTVVRKVNVFTSTGVAVLCTKSNRNLS